MSTLNIVKVPNLEENIFKNVAFKTKALQSALNALFAK